MKAEIEAALADLRSHYADLVDAIPLPDGSAKVTVGNLPLEGGPYVQTDTWCGFTITYMHPYADIYPHFVRHDLSRRDGASFGASIHGGRDFYGRPAIMLSRRTRICGAEYPMHVRLKLEKVIQWLVSQ